MAMIKCPKCEKDISDKAIKCVHCGYAINSTDTENTNNVIDEKLIKKYKKGYWIMSVIVVIASILIPFFSSGMSLAGCLDVGASMAVVCVLTVGAIFMFIKR